jgi:hypothetical protein
LLVLLSRLRRAFTAFRPARVADVPVLGVARPRSRPTDTLELLTWNIGYAGLGSDADFVADGGRHLRTKKRSTVDRNVAAITELLQAEQPDAVLAQELARAGYLTHGVDVLEQVREALDGYELAFAPTVHVAALPLVGGLELGQGTFAIGGLSSAKRHALPSPTALPGITFQNFHVLETRLQAAGDGPDWVLYNVHLPAFDGGALRRQQLVDVLELLMAEYGRGSYVIAGGDWNLRLADTAFPYTTAEKSKSWVRDLPSELTPAGWSWAVDASSPTNRTLEQRYRPGINYTSVIDGFLVSPNVDVLDVTTLDLGFANSDHNPVRTTVRASYSPDARRSASEPV